MDPQTSVSRLRRSAFWLAAAVLPLALALGVPAASAKMPDAIIASTCTPDTFQPDAWTAIECVTVITNTGQNDIQGAHFNIATVSESIPSYFWVSLVIDGAPFPVGALDVDFPVPQLQPGQSSTSHLLALVKMPRGTWSGVDSVIDPDGRELGRLYTHLTADSQATAPSQDLQVTKKLVRVDAPSADGTSPSSSTMIYETRVTNQSSSTVTDLTLIDRTDYAELFQAEPSPATRESDFSLTRWDLSSFDRDSLAPGESLSVRLTYRATYESGCSLTSSGVVAEATIDGKVERAGAPPEGDYEDSCYIHDDSATGAGGVIPARTGRGDLPFGFGTGGEGPSDSTFDLIWAATFLAAAGAALVGLAMLARRKVRR